MAKKITIAVIGCGSFARNFVPLFKAHPYVEKTYVCDIIPERAQEYNKLFDVEIIPSFEDAIRNPQITAVAIFTQRHLHGDLVKAALKAGKDVYSAVPMGISVEECQEIVELVKQTGKTYMMGETCIYYPCSMFCKKEYEKGTFGKFVYGESQYHHDISHFPKNFLEDKLSAGVPPFFYPTHSTAMLLHALSTHATRVVAFGFEEEPGNGIYEKGINQWDNVYSNGYSLMKLANGGTARVNECRRIGYKAPSSYVSSFYGTKGSYQFNNAQHMLYFNMNEKGLEAKDVSDQVNPREMEVHRVDEGFKNQVANHTWQWDMFSPQQDERVSALPESYKDLPNGHMASHQLLIDDFCTAAYFEKMPTVNAWLAARYTIPGLLAHESMIRNGQAFDVPDCGDAPV